MCNAGEHLLRADKQEEAGSYFRRARGVAEAHGFFSVECRACKNLGKVAMLERRPEEGVEMLRHALVGLATLIPKPETRNPKPEPPKPKPSRSGVAGREPRQQPRDGRAARADRRAHHDQREQHHHRAPRRGGESSPPAFRSEPNRDVETGGRLPGEVHI